MSKAEETLNLCRQFNKKVKQNSKLLILPFFKYQKYHAHYKEEIISQGEEILRIERKLLNNFHETPDMIVSLDEVYKNKFMLMDLHAQVISHSIPNAIIWHSMPDRLRNNKTKAQIAEDNNATTLARLIRTTKKPKFFIK